ncbi:hypothetical protein BDB01DRAFT_897326 [Pilobolus umbonatus]|nr:hypothetical protein BDB01DRAFT_897326 [Pilobolus umbonatus]
MFSSDSSLICHMSDVLFMSATVCCLKKGVTIFTSLYCKTSSGVLQVYISSAFITEDVTERLTQVFLLILIHGITKIGSRYTIAYNDYAKKYYRIKNMKDPSSLYL